MAGQLNFLYLRLPIQLHSSSSVRFELHSSTCRLLGDCDIPTAVPNSESCLQENVEVVGNASYGSKLSRRIASLMRFREKRKERYFEKKIRYSCRKEVVERMNRKNGQFTSSKDSYNTDVVNSN
ncbi:GATA transcription factor 24-like [Pistacia vera]|uniref:GATA transcription factor 24-like n=1 Tax=Pistacia vera TaxID=55513 RepID=UPI0012633A39|nr:GATA transcription factor 24-like [Pistacia vera]